MSDRNYEQTRRVKLMTHSDPTYEAAAGLLRVVDGDPDRRGVSRRVVSKASATGPRWTLSAPDVQWSRCACHEDTATISDELGVRCRACARWRSWTTDTTQTAATSIRVYVSRRVTWKLSGRDTDDLDPQVRRKRNASLTALPTTAEQLELLVNSDVIDAAVSGMPQPRASVTHTNDAVTFTALCPRAFLRERIVRALEASYGADWDRYMAIDDAPTFDVISVNGSRTV